MAAAVDGRITVGDRLFGWRFNNLLNADGALHTFTAPKIRMVNAADSTDVVLNWATAVSPSAGVITYAPAAADVDVAGTYALQVQDTAGALSFHWPTGREWLLEIVPVVWLSSGAQPLVWALHAPHVL